MVPCVALAKQGFSVSEVHWIKTLPTVVHCIKSIFRQDYAHQPICAGLAMNFRNVATIIILLLLSSCGRVVTQHHTSEPIEIHRLFILAELAPEDNRVFASAFANTIMDSLQSCGIIVKFVNVPVKDRSLSLDDNPYIAANTELQEFKSDAMMRVTQGQTNEIAVALDGLNIYVQLFKPENTPADTLKWNGRFFAGTGLSAADGTALAQSIMQNAQKENVFKNCSSHSGNVK